MNSHQADTAKYGAATNLHTDIERPSSRARCGLLSRNKPEATATSQFLDEKQNINTCNLHVILRDSKNLNRLYRIPTAHLDIVTVETWTDGSDMILDPRQGLLSG